MIIKVLKQVAMINFRQFLYYWVLIAGLGIAWIVLKTDIDEQVEASNVLIPLLVPITESSDSPLLRKINSDLEEIQNGLKRGLAPEAHPYFKKYLDSDTAALWLNLQQNLNALADSMSAKNEPPYEGKFKFLQTFDRFRTYVRNKPEPDQIDLFVLLLRSQLSGVTRVEQDSNSLFPCYPLVSLGNAEVYVGKPVDIRITPSVIQSEGASFNEWIYNGDTIPVQQGIAHLKYEWDKEYRGLQSDDYNMNIRVREGGLPDLISIKSRK